MSEPSPTIDLLILPEPDGFRLMSAGARLGVLRRLCDPRGDIFPVPKPDADDLHEFMWSVDAPYTGGRTKSGGLEIRATGRAAICLTTWLGEYLEGKK